VCATELRVATLAPPRLAILIHNSVAKSRIKRHLPRVATLLLEPSAWLFNNSDDACLHAH
jgi:hypothetical protein